MVPITQQHLPLRTILVYCTVTVARPQRRSGCKRRGEPASSRRKSKARLHLLKELVYISQEMAQPDEIFKIFPRRCTREKVVLLTRLFSMLASPEAFDQLSEACTITRQKANGISSDSLDSLEQTMQTLDKLDIAKCRNRGPCIDLWRLSRLDDGQS